MAAIGPVFDHLAKCVARIYAGDATGTGFFVAPGQLLTCAHVMAAAKGKPARLRVEYAGTVYAARLLRMLDGPFPDLALLSVDVPNHPVVLLSPEVAPGTRLYAFGFTERYPGGEPTTVEYEGQARLDLESGLMKFKGGQIIPGLSGAPLLNMDNWAIAGIVKSTRDRASDLGGGGVSSQTILEVLPEITPLQRKFHSSDKRWMEASQQQRERGDAGVKAEVGLGQRLSPYAGEIHNFVDAYLGTRERAVPFGGREKELESLDRWLTDAAAAPYALIVAQAGRGKSALLAQWAHSLRKSKRVQVVFIPVSIRFETALSSVTFSVLAAGLAEAFGETSKNIPPEQLKSVSLEYMRKSLPNGLNVVVIIDGLDEASDWEPGPSLFPRPPGAGIRAVVSARYLAGDVDERGWLHRLGWDQPPCADTIPLAPLTRNDLHAVLASMGDPLAHLKTDVDLVGQLFRLSQGDPLTVRLYVNALSETRAGASRLRPEDLSSIQEGLKGFVDQSMKDQARRAERLGRPALWRDQDVVDFLNLCAAAMGPLSRDDVAEIAGGPLASGLLDGVVQEVDRFVYGDGQSKGFVFSHPRFAHHFSERMGKAKLAEWNERILKYGSQTLDALNGGTLDPSAASRYVIQYYRAHLERSKAASQDLYALATIGWMRGWQSVEVAHAGFLADIESVAHRAESSDLPLAPQALATLVCCAICRSSVVALRTSMPPNLLAACVQEGVFSPLQALTIARQAPDGEPIAEALSHLAAMPRFDLNDEAFASAVMISDPKVRSRAAVAVGKHVSRELKPKAIAFAQDLENISDKALALAELASSLEAGSQVVVERQALAVALAIKDRRSRVDTLSELVTRLHGDEKSTAIQKAFEAARKLPERDLSESPVCDAFARLAQHLPDPLKKKALAMAQKIEDPEARVRTFACLAPHLDEPAQSQVLQSALSIAIDLESNLAKARCLADLLPCPCLQGEQKTRAVSQAWKAARSIDDVEWRPMMLARLAPQLPPELREEAIDAARKEGGWGHATVLIALAHKLFGQQLQGAVDSAWDIKDESQRADALAHLSPNLPEPRKRQALERALDAAHGISHGRHAQAFVTIAPYLSPDLAIKARKLTGAEGSMSAIEALIGLATHLPVGLRADAARDALSAVRAIRDDVESVRVLIDIAPYLSPTDPLVADIEEAAGATGTSADRARALVLLAACLSNAEKQAPLVTKALAMMEHLPAWDGFTSPRAAMLGVLAQHTDTKSAALEMARLLKPAAAKAKGLTAIARALDEPSRSTVIGEALTASRAIANPQHKAFALARLVELLPEDERPTVADEALEAARKSTYPLTIASAVRTVALHLDDARLEQLLATTFPAFDGEVLTDVLISLAPRLETNPELMRQAQDLVDAIKDDDERWAARVALAPYRKEPDSMQKALRNLPSRPGSAWTRAMALARLAKHLPAMEKGAALQPAMVMMKAISTNELRRQVADTLSPQFPEWASQDPRSAYVAWKDALRELSMLPRPMFLPYLRMLLPLGLALTDASQRKSAAAECACVVKDATRWPWGKSSSPGA